MLATPHPLPDVALDDRLAFVGTSGSGKTYAAGTAVERLLQGGARVVIIDPLDVWWGLRLRQDGVAPSGLDVAILGGTHGDLALTEESGAVIGGAVAASSQSAVVSLGGLPSKAAERRFMRAFLTAIYDQAAGEPVHLIFDEADLWAPQRSGPETAGLLGAMENIVRRGRVKGLIPWLITQRPAVISKDVLSQMDGMVAMKLTGAHDRKAIAEWIGGSMDGREVARVVDALPTRQRGEGMLWAPARQILQEVKFPAKATYDSSRTPTRGERRAAVKVQPIDIAGLRAALAEKPAAEKPPKGGANAAPSPAPDLAALEAAERRGYERGVRAAADRVRGAALYWAPPAAKRETLIETADRHPVGSFFADDILALLGEVRSAVALGAAQPNPKISAKRQPAAINGGGPHGRVLNALALWRRLGFEQPTREQIAAIAGYSPSSGGFANLLGQLRIAGKINYPAPGKVTATNAGAVEAPPDDRPVIDIVCHHLSGPQEKIVRELARLPRAATREDLAGRTGYSTSSGGYANLLGSLRTLGIIDYPGRGEVALQDWVRK